MSLVIRHTIKTTIQANLKHSPFHPRFRAISLLMFPGTGAEKVGMCSELRHSPAASKLIAGAEATTGVNMTALFNSQKDLAIPELCMLAMFIGSLAKIEQLKETNSCLIKDTEAVGSLGMGVYAALVFTEALDFNNALRLIRLVGRMLTNVLDDLSTNHTKTGMVSVSGPKVEEFVLWLVHKFPTMRITAYLGDNLVIVGGLLTDCHALSGMLNGDPSLLPFSEGISHANLVPTEAAYHTEYMKSLADKEAHLLGQLALKPPKLPVLLGSSGKIGRNPEDLRQDLKALTTCPVMLRDGLKTAYGELGIRKIVEVSPSPTMAYILESGKEGSFPGLVTELARF